MLNNEVLKVSDPLNGIMKEEMNNPAFLNYSFSSLSRYIDIINTNDKSFRIYSWDTYTGGTRHIFYAVAQFQGSEGKVYTQPLVDNSEGNAGLWYSKIYTFNKKGNKYYFCIGHGKYSTMDLAQEVLVYTVKGNLLLEAPIIKTQKGLTNSIHVNYDLPTVQDKYNQSIVFDEIRNELKIPLVKEKGKMTNKNIIYKFNGTHFIRNGIK